MRHLREGAKQREPSGAQCQDQRARAHTGTQEGPSELQETLFHFEYDQALVQLAGEAVEAPFSEMSSSCLDTVLDSQPWVTLLGHLLLQQGLDQVISRNASPQPATALFLQRNMEPFVHPKSHLGTGER